MVNGGETLFSNCVRNATLSPSDMYARETDSTLGRRARLTAALVSMNFSAWKDEGLHLREQMVLALALYHAGD